MRALAILLLLGLTSCEGGMQAIDAKKVLSNMEGPKVPTIQDTLMETAKNAEKQGDYAQAAQLYQQILEKQPNDKNVLLSLADCLRRSGDIDRALAVYDAVLQQDATMVAAKEGKSLALMSKGDFDTPGVLLAEVMKVDATRWKTLNAMGILFSVRNMQPEAQAYYLEALKYSMNNPSVLNNLGLSQALSKHFDAAIASLQQASTLTASNGGDRKRIDLNLSLVYASAGKLDEARAIAERYFTGAVLNNNLGLYAHLAKDDQLAKAYLNMALTESKTFYEKAWDNLQSIDNNGVSSQSASDKVNVKSGSQDVTPEAAAKPEEKKAEKPKEKPKKAAAPKVKKEEAKPAPAPEAEVKPAAPSDVSAIVSDTADKPQVPLAQQ